MTAKTILPRFDMGLANSIKWPMRMHKRFKLIGLAIVLAMATAMTDCSDPSADSVDSQQRIAPLFALHILQSRQGRSGILIRD